MMLEVFALIVLAVVCAVAIWLVVIFGNLPGKLAREVNHPQADAIALLGWIGLLTAGIGWGVALVWSRTRDQSGPTPLDKRVSELEIKVRQLEDNS